MKRDSIQTYRTPFTVEELMGELRIAVWCNASQIALSGLPDVANTYLGFEAEFGPNDSGEPYLSRIDLARFQIAHIFQSAYDFSFQVGNVAAFTEDHWMDIAAFRSGAAGGDWEGIRSPIMSLESKLSHVADMAMARMKLMHGNALTIRDLCLLANMTEAAVRSALSTEGIRTEGRPASLDANTAAAWLGGRRGFVPTTNSGADGFAENDAVEEAFLNLPLGDGMTFLMNRKTLGLGSLANMSQVRIDRLGQLVVGNTAEFDVSTLVRIASILEVDPKVFLKRITLHVLEDIPSS